MTPNDDTGWEHKQTADTEKGISLTSSSRLSVSLLDSLGCLFSLNSLEDKETNGTTLLKCQEMKALLPQVLFEADSKHMLVQCVLHNSLQNIQKCWIKPLQIYSKNNDTNKTTLLFMAFHTHKIRECDASWSMWLTRDITHDTQSTAVSWTNMQLLFSSNAIKVHCN